MYIYRSDEMATKGSDSSKYQSTICSLLNLSSLAISTSVIVPTPYTCLSQEGYDLQVQRRMDLGRRREI
jgi:hypothetical protein